MKPVKAVNVQVMNGQKRMVVVQVVFYGFLCWYCILG